MKTNHLPIGARKSLTFFQLALVLLGGCLSAPANTANQVAPSAQHAESIRVGTDAPDADLADLEGKDVTLHA
ncbi:MAG TPA: hypothetical protein VHS80_02275, partial [Chthoniobacterales bacterium]|nr:hypothetical protein [Chthoniobacterales bacterium]